ncbi:hypothetical protein [Leptospira idonii]|uniref:Uncharacterized protein n=1 Tax=Leptospira idonii TaxID=1193500 RepID=A0A4R9M1M6_9LEPT|nr:hypothetical protein [Leptospira idonii]TGN20620.1 hypothetical protein EHS15_03250 [Leptospira idonii]
MQINNNEEMEIFRPWPGWLQESEDGELLQDHDIDGKIWDGFISVEPKPENSGWYSRSYFMREQTGFELEIYLKGESAKYNIYYRYITYKGMLHLVIANNAKEGEAFINHSEAMAASFRRAYISKDDHDSWK